MQKTLLSTSSTKHKSLFMDFIQSWLFGFIVRLLKPNVIHFVEVAAFHIKCVLIFDAHMAVRHSLCHILCHNSNKSLYM